MSSHRLDTGGLIDRSQRLTFRFDGRKYHGHPGDTLASALLANGVRIVGRSFKYHRPRGVWGAWSDDPNAIVDVRLGSRQIANCQATTMALEDGMRLGSVGGWPGVRLDLLAGLDLLHRVLPAGFYYKTFFWPNWQFWEPMIRRMAGLGRVDPDRAKDYRAFPIHDQAGLLVVGGGVAGLTAARVAAQAGEDVLLVDDQAHPGGGIFATSQAPGGTDPQTWVAEQIEAIRAAGGRVMATTTALGVHDHGLVSLARLRDFARPPQLIALRARRILLATGAIERPLTLANNDRPGIMATSAAGAYLGRHGVLVGRDIAILSNNSHAETVAQRLRDAGAQVGVLDPGDEPVRILGRRRVRGLRIGNRRIPCDTLLTSGGFTPTLHLWRQGGGKLTWAEEINAFVPGDGPRRMAVTGAAAGIFDRDQAIAHAMATALGSRPPPVVHDLGLKPDRAIAPTDAGRAWVDFQGDVTTGDIRMAAGEGYRSVEHVKRYTTLGMATDQGKTSNMAGLDTLARAADRPIPEIGTTTFRPPYVPVALASLAGPARGALLHPLKRLPLEPLHRNAGAALCEYGGWLRPGWYGTDRAGATRDEALAVRRDVGILDASPLGKVEVMGPGAAQFLDFVFYNRISTLAPGRLRYGFLLREDGSIFDDAVVARLAPERFVVSCSSAHVGAVVALLETWRQDNHDPDAIFIHDTTDRWQTLTITGPRARACLAGLLPNTDLAAGALPHMALTTAQFDGAPVRVARVSFTGELSYELSLPPASARALWRIAMAKGLRPVGMEALSILRLEKGYVLVGRDTDSQTTPPDLGFAGPLKTKPRPYLGDRGLLSPAAKASERRHLVGLSVPRGSPPLPVGAHLVKGRKHRSLGFVTSSGHSPALDRPIALALLEDGQAKMGKKVTIWHMGKRRRAVVCPACAYDPEGERINA